MNKLRKVLVVEDEAWVRRGLIQMIPWHDLGLELIGEAGDGETAFDIAASLRPDIVILDMNMPGWDGRVLMHHIYKSAPEIVMIVVSGYSDFAYTREAIRYNTLEYLLKPVKEDELIRVLTKAIQQMNERESASQSFTSDQWLYQQLFKGHSDSTERMEHFTANDKVVGIMQLESGDWGESLEALTSIEPISYVFQSPDYLNEAVFVLMEQQLQMKYVKQLLQSIIKQLAKDGISISIAVSDVETNVEQLRDAYYQAQRILSRKSVRATQQVLDSSALAVKSASFYPQEQEHRFLLALQHGNARSAESALHDFFLALDHQTITIGMLRQAVLLFIHSVEKWISSYHSNLEAICGYNPLSISEKFKQMTSPSEMRDELFIMWLPTLPDFFKSAMNTSGLQITKEIVKEIETSYFMPLSLQEMAEKKHMNADYLSRLFKKLTGFNFVDYLTDYRIGKAKDLLETGQYKNYEVASMVGYDDYRYFSQVFKKRTNQTIGEYRQEHAQTRSR